jgi:hypothetical protein
LLPASFLDLGEYLVDGQPEHVLDHSREVDFQQLTGLFNAGVGVHLDEPDVEVLVQDEVVAEELETGLTTEGVDLLTHRVHALDDQLLHLGHKVFFHGNRTFISPRSRIHLINNLLKPLIPQLIPILKLPIVLCELLHGVVRQVHILIVHIIQVDLVV